jgi:hypothetical protein
MVFFGPCFRASGTKPALDSLTRGSTKTQSPSSPTIYNSHISLAMSVNFPQEEERILKRWKEINAFARQVELSKGKQPYTFYGNCRIFSTRIYLLSLAMTISNLET